MNDEILIKTSLERLKTVEEELKLLALSDTVNKQKINNLELEIKYLREKYKYRLNTIQEVQDEVNNEIKIAKQSYKWVFGILSTIGIIIAFIVSVAEYTDNTYISKEEQQIQKLEKMEVNIVNRLNRDEKIINKL